MIFKVLIFTYKLQIESVHKDGRVVFQDGCIVSVDVILHWTGYAIFDCFAFSMSVE